MAFWRKTEKRSIPPAENQLPLMGPLSMMASGRTFPAQVTPLAALGIADVWAAVRVLADGVSSLPLHVYRHAGDARERVTSGRLVDLITRPGPGSSQADLVSTLMTHLAIYGNGFVAKYREAGEVTQLGLLDPLRIRPELEGGRLRFRYSPGTGPQVMLTEADVIHVKGLSVDGLVGLSAVSQASRVLGLSDELVKHALSYFDSGEFQRPAGILRVAPDSSFPGMDRTKEKLRADAKPHGVVVIEGDAEFQAITSPLDDAQFVEQRRLAAQEVARVFRIPPHMLGAPSGDSLTYATVEQESIDFVRYSLTPWLRRIELAISNDGDLAFQRQFVKFEVDGLLRADAATRSEVYSRALDPITGWLDVDEVRALEDLPPRPAREPVAPAMNGSGPVPVEGRSRDDEVADAIRALSSQPPVVNVNPPPVRTRRRVVRDEDGPHRGDRGRAGIARRARAQHNKRKRGGDQPMSTIQRPKTGEVEERQAPALEVEGKKIRGRIPYGTESRDMGGWREIIEPTALRNTKLDDLVATVDHAGVPLGRFPTTLNLEDRSDGLHWSLVPPESRSDVREAIERGDLRAGSWRMRVARDEWRGDVRHVHEIAELRDVSVVTSPAYPHADVEFRSAPTTADDAPQKDTEMSEDTKTEERQLDAKVTSEPQPVLQVEDRAEGVKFVSLMEEFRSRGFPEETASVSADEFRAATFGGTIDVLNQNKVAGGPLGYDQRWAWQVPPQVSVDAGVTSVQVFQQTARSLTAGTAVIRDIDAVTNKPEVGSTLNVLTVPMKQVAGVQTGIPNVYLEQQQLASVVENDLRLSVYGGLDELVRAAIAASGFQAPSTDNILVSIRKAITTLRASGYVPDTLLLTPAASETIDTMVSGISGGTADFTFGPAQFAPGTLFGLRRVESKVLAAPVVLDSKAHGKLYLSPISLARFEENAGRTNTSLVRLEGHAAYGTERTAAAVRIAAS